MSELTIKKAEANDFEIIYALATQTPELKVSEQFTFMTPTELKMILLAATSVFLIATEEDRLAGFIYASISDVEMPKDNWACLVYIVVDPNHRRRGIAKKLLKACLRELKKKKITHVYGWASLSGDQAVVQFLQQEGFMRGHDYCWMDKKI